MPTLTRVAPELPVFDVERSVRYYETKLGFHLAMSMPDGDYAIVERDDVALHLYRVGALEHTPVSVHIFTAGLDELQQELKRRGAPIQQEILLQPWGNRDFRVQDPSDNVLKFTEPMDEDPLSEPGLP